MKFHTMTAMVALLLLTTVPAMAANDTNTIVTTPPSKSDNMTEEIKGGLRSADESMSNTVEDIKAFFVGRNANDKLEPVLIRSNLTAHGLIGATIVTEQGKKIADVKDIIIGRDGKAALVVVSDAGLLGIGTKVAAFSYDRVVSLNADGKVVMVLTQDLIDKAADFSYDQRDWAKAKVIPAGSVSVNALLKGDVLDNDDKVVANIENVYIRNANVSQIIVRFNKTLGMGGELAALDFDDLQLVKKDDKFNFKLTYNQTMQFKSFKASVAN